MVLKQTIKILIHLALVFGLVGPLNAATGLNPTNVKVMVVAPKKMRVYKSYIGHLKPRERVVVRSETSGSVEKINFEEGQRVQQGDVLVHISTEELELRKMIAETNYNQALSDYEIEKRLYFSNEAGTAKQHVSLKQLALQTKMAKTDYDHALSEYKVQKNLFEKKMASTTSFDSYKTNLAMKRLALQQSELVYQQGQVKDSAHLNNYRNRMLIHQANLKLADLELEKSKIKAPFSGIVKQKMVQLGGFIQKGKDLLEVMDISNVMVRVNIPEQEMKFAALGKEVAVRLDAALGEKFAGRIKTLGLEADLKCRCFPAEIEIKNKEQKLLPGMMARVEMLAKSGQNQVIIPRHAVLERQRGSVVFVVNNGQAVQRSVKTGEMIGENIQILNGLTFGDLLIVVGQDLLTNDEFVKVVNKNQKIVSHVTF